MSIATRRLKAPCAICGGPIEKGQEYQQRLDFNVTIYLSRYERVHWKCLQPDEAHVGKQEVTP